MQIEVQFAPVGLAARQSAARFRDSSAFASSSTWTADDTEHRTHLRLRRRRLLFLKEREATTTTTEVDGEEKAEVAKAAAASR